MRAKWPWTFSQSLVLQAYKQEKSSISLVIRGLQIKTTGRVNFIPIRLAKIKRLDSAKCWRDYEATGVLICAGGSGTWELTLEEFHFS